MKGPLSQLFSVLFVSVLVLQGCSSNSKDRGDVRPDEFTVTSAQSEAEPNTLVESQPFTITGINREATVTLSSEEITDARFKVNGGEPKESGSTVSNGDEVVIMGTTPAAYGGEATITVDIGGEQSEFAITIGEDETPPEVSILFPPPSSMTEGETVFVRGTVEDLYGEVSTLMVNSVEVDISEGLPEWSANVPVNEGENTITVTAMDVAGNENNDHSVNVRMDPEGGPFPDNENPTEFLAVSGDFASLNGIEMYLVPDNYSRVIGVDIETGRRSVIVENSEDDETSFSRLQFLVVGDEDIFVNDLSAAYKINKDSGAIEVVIDERNDIVSRPRSLAYAEIDETPGLYVSDGNRVYWIDIAEYSVVPFINGDGQNVDQGIAEFESIRALSLSSDQTELYFVTSEGIYAADVLTGQVSQMLHDEGGLESYDLDALNQSIFWVSAGSTSPSVRKYNAGEGDAEISGTSNPVAENPFVAPTGIDCRDDLSYCLVVDLDANSIFAVDRSTGHRVVLTRSVQE